MYADAREFVPFSLGATRHPSVGAARSRNFMDFCFVDDQSQKVVHKERQSDAKRDSNEKDPQQGLNQYVAKAEGANKLVLLHGYVPRNAIAEQE
jgi:hypothetical protein